jgi:hypothetical protein
VTIEYPGGITLEALTLLREMRRTTPLWAVDSTRVQKGRQTVRTDAYIDQRILDQINKSRYYALRVFDFLMRSHRFATDTLALRAVTIDVEI